MHMDLPLAFALVSALAVGFYMLADGCDLGIGVLFLLAPRDRDRDLMMESMAPVWDGNETWLVMGGSCCTVWTGAADGATLRFVGVGVGRGRGNRRAHHPGLSRPRLLGVPGQDRGSERG